MTYLKTLIALTGLALLTACGGATPTATGDPSQTTDCAANPFGASCIAEDIALPARITDCITAGNAGDTKCASLTSDTAMNTAINTCLTNPFDESCTESDFTFSTYVEKARTNRVSFCGMTGNETDALCPALVRTCIANPFSTNCGGTTFRVARERFCVATPDNDDCRADVLMEDLMSVADPCADGACVDFADLPDTILTTPTVKFEQEPDGNGGMQDTTTETDDFADGFLKVTLNTLAVGTSLLNPDGTDNTTIDPAPFNMGGITGVTVQEGTTRIRRRGGRGSSDDDGFVTFRLLKANADNSVLESVRDSLHGAILPTTNLGAPLTSTEPLTNAVWSGYYYYTNDSAIPTDFFITFEAGLPNDQIGRIGFANPTKDGIGTGDNRPDFAKRQFVTIALAVTFDADGVLAGTITSTNFTAFATLDIVGLIGTEGVVALGVNNNVAAGFTATNPDGRAIPVLDPCIGGLAACYGKHAFWVSNARNSDDTDFLKIKPAGTADKDIDDSSGHFIAGGVDAQGLLNFNNPNPANVATLTLSNLEGSNDANSGFSAVRVFDVNSYSYVGLLSDTNVGAPFTDANPPAAEWTAIVQMATSATSAHSPVTLDVAFTGGAGTIKTRTGGIDYGITGNLTIDGKFGANGVIYGDVTINDTNDFLVGDHTLSGLIGVDGAVGVFTGPGFAGGFVARPTP